MAEHLTLLPVLLSKQIRLIFVMLICPCQLTIAKYTKLMTCKSFGDIAISQKSLNIVLYKSFTNFCQLRINVLGSETSKYSIHATSTLKQTVELLI